MLADLKFAVRNIGTLEFDAAFVEKDDAFMWRDTEMRPEDFQVFEIAAGKPAIRNIEIPKLRRGRSKRAFYGIRKLKKS